MPEGTPATESAPAPEATGGAPAGTPNAPATEAPAAPKWEGDFDPDRAARLVENLRTEARKAKEDLAEARKVLDAKADAEKTESQRLQERAEKAERDAAEARQSLMVAKAVRKHGIPDDLVDFLTGKTEEEIEAKAERLAAQIAKPSTGESLSRRPKASLVPGSVGDGEPPATFDPVAIAKAARDRS